MSYNTILVHVDESKQLEKRVEVAAKLALHEKAHLIGVAATGISQSLHRPALPATSGGAIEAFNAEYMASLRQRAEVALGKFEDMVRALGVASCEKRLIDDEAADAVSMQGRYADIIILGQSDADDPALTAKVDFPEYVVLNSECPVLIIPFEGRVFSIGERVLIAWNASMAASRAVRNALPFLKQAKTVQVATAHPASQPVPHQHAPGEDIVAYLNRHGIKAEVIESVLGEDAGHTLLTLASDLSCDLIIMGCVAHPRARSMLLGGTTRVVLESTTVPVLMSH